MKYIFIIFLLSSSCSLIDLNKDKAIYDLNFNRDISFDEYKVILNRYNDKKNIQILIKK